MAKPIIRWRPVRMKDPSNRNNTVVVPTIVDRSQPIDLTDLAYAAIDTGRIPGLKTSAAKAIGEGLAEQIGATLERGAGVKFGNYFYVRPYLSGTIDPSAKTLGEENKLNVRLSPGEGLKLDKGQYSFENVSLTGEEPRIDYLVNAGTGAGERGVINPALPVLAIGAFLNSPLYTDYHAYVSSEDGTTDEEAVIASANETVIQFRDDAFSGLDAGAYRVNLVGKDANGEVKTVATAAFTVVASGNEPRIAAVQSAGLPADSVANGVEARVTGANLDGASVTLSWIEGGVVRTATTERADDGLVLTVTDRAADGFAFTLEEGPEVGAIQAGSMILTVRTAAGTASKLVTYVSANA